jgi:hypothetical protein
MGAAHKCNSWQCAPILQEFVAAHPTFDRSLNKQQTIRQDGFLRQTRSDCQEAQEGRRFSSNKHEFGLTQTAVVVPPSIRPIQVRTLSMEKAKGYRQPSAKTV